MPIEKRAESGTVCRQESPATGGTDELYKRVRVAVMVIDGDE
jgi:hypothetical protein